MVGSDLLNLQVWLTSCLNGVQMFREIAFVRVVYLINWALNQE